jgi:hypothetical protein
VTASFLSLDPLFEAGSPLEMGGYASAANNPVSDSDPSGLHPCDPAPDGQCLTGSPAPPSLSPNPGSCPSSEPGCLASPAAAIPPAASWQLAPVVETPRP